MADARTQIHAPANDPDWAARLSLSTTTARTPCAQVFPLCCNGVDLDLHAPTAFQFQFNDIAAPPTSSSFYHRVNVSFVGHRLRLNPGCNHKPQSPSDADVPSPGGWSAIECCVDDVPARTLNAYAFTNDKMSIGHCALLGHPIADVEYARECYRGGAVIADSSCDMA
ncbi:hypothetical protein V8D89_002915 [Ganoderma adspersum]